MYHISFNWELRTEAMLSSVTAISAGYFAAVYSDTTEFAKWFQEEYVSEQTNTAFKSSSQGETGSLQQAVHLPWPGESLL